MVWWYTLARVFFFAFLEDREQNAQNFVKPRDDIPSQSIPSVRRCDLRFSVWRGDFQMTFAKNDASSCRIPIRSSQLRSREKPKEWQLAAKQSFRITNSRSSLFRHVGSLNLSLNSAHCTITRMAPRHVTRGNSTSMTVPLNIIATECPEL